MYAIVIDISARKRFEEAEKKFHDYFEMSTVPQAITSLEGVFLNINNALAGMLGYSKDELVGKRYLDITHPDDFSTTIEHTNYSAQGDHSNHSPSQGLTHLTRLPVLFHTF